MYLHKTTRWRGSTIPSRRWKSVWQRLMNKGWLRCFIFSCFLLNSVSQDLLHLTSAILYFYLIKIREGVPSRSAWIQLHALTRILSVGLRPRYPKLWNHCLEAINIRAYRYVRRTYLKVKVKFILEQATKIQEGSTVIAQLLLQPRFRITNLHYVENFVNHVASDDRS